MKRCLKSSKVDFGPARGYSALIIRKNDVITHIKNCFKQRLIVFFCPCPTLTDGLERSVNQISFSACQSSHLFTWLIDKTSWVTSDRNETQEWNSYARKIFIQAIKSLVVQRKWLKKLTLHFWKYVMVTSAICLMSRLPLQIINQINWKCRLLCK